MFKYLVILVFSLFTSTSFANARCDKKVSKAEMEKCYKKLVFERKEALEEYYEDIMASSNIPANVKAAIDQEYRNFMKNIYSFCPDNSCVETAMMEQIKDMYEQTRKWTVPQSK